MQGYSYDAETGEFTNQITLLVDPETPGRWQVPEDCTTEPVPTVGDGQAARWAGVEWEVVTDHRGEYWLPDGSAHFISDLGVERPAGALTEKPKTPVHVTADVAITAAYQWIEQLVHTKIDGGKPLSEVMTYQTRAAAARAVVAGKATDEDTGVLVKLLVASGLDETAAVAGVATLAATIKTKADARDTALAFTTAMRQQVEAQIAAADVEADPFAFDKILAQAAVDAKAKWVELKTQTTTTTGGQNNA